MTDKETFMTEMRHHLSGELDCHDAPISPPTTSMKNDVVRADDQIPKKDKPLCHRTSHTSWRGGRNRR